MIFLDIIFENITSESLYADDDTLFVFSLSMRKHQFNRILTRR